MYRKLIEEKRYEEALDYLDKHASSFIDLSYVYDQKGRLYHLLGDLDQALLYLHQAYALDEDLVTLEEIGNCYFELERIEEAKQCYEKCGNIKDVIECEMVLGLFDEAIEHLKTLEESEEVNIDLMICYEMIGEDQKAKSYALKEYQHDSAILNELIIINERLQDYDFYYIDLMKEIDLDLGLYYEGCYRNRMDQYNRAIESFKQIESLTIEGYKAYIYALVKENKREDAYILAIELYDLSQEKEDLIELIEIGSITNREDLKKYLELYLEIVGEDEFIIKKMIRYELNFDLEKGKQYIEQYKDHYEIDEELLILENRYLEKEDLSINENQKKILKLRGCEIEYPITRIRNTPLPYQDIERVYEFSEGLAYIENKEYGGFIDLSGKLIIDFKLPKDHSTRMDTYMFHHQQVIIMDHEKYCLLDHKGNTLIDQADAMSFTKEGIYYQKNGNTYIDGKEYKGSCGKEKQDRIVYGKHLQGYLNKAGKVVIEAKYEQCGDFHEGYAMVKENRLIGYIDLDGRKVILPQYIEGHKVYGRQAAIKKDYWGVIDLDGHTILEMIYDEIKEDEKYYYVCKDHQWGVFKHNGEKLIDCMYDEILYYWNGVARVKAGEYYGMVDEKGRVVIPIVFDHVTYAKKGVTIVGLGSRFGYMSIKTGKLLTSINLSTATLQGTDDLLNISIGKNFYIIKGEELWKN